MKILVGNWKTLDDVPIFYKNWAEYVAEHSLNLEEIKELVESYEIYLNYLDDTEKHDSTIGQ